MLRKRRRRSKKITKKTGWKNIYVAATDLCFEIHLTNTNSENGSNLIDVIAVNNCHIDYTPLFFAEWNDISLFHKPFK